jgi:thiamine pyrophosphate-dependent acetolactate synthase large subunit-like protein
MAKRVADIVVETLQAAGVKHRWGVPGDTLNFVTDAIRRSDIEWVHVRHEEVAGFAAGAEAMLTGDLTACAGSCGPGSLHFINGLFESHRNRAPVVLIASQIIFDEIGFDFPQEVDYGPIYKSCSVFCDEIRTPAQARRKTAMAAQAALSKRGVAVLVLPIDVSKAHAPDEPAFAVKATPNRQVISLSGDGGQSMLLGDLITAVQEKIPDQDCCVQQRFAGFRRARDEGRGPPRYLHQPRESGFRPRGSGYWIPCATGGAGGRTGSSCARLDCRSGAGTVGCRNR